jgi:hypothetical protein
MPGLRVRPAMGDGEVSVIGVYGGPIDKFQWMLST